MSTATIANVARKRRPPAVEALLPSAFLYPGLLFILVTGVYPFLFAVSLAFRSYYIPTPATSHWIGFQNFANLLQDADFWNSVWVTVRYIAAAVVLEGVFGFAIALLLDARLRFNALWRTVVLIPMILAPVVVGSMWRFMFNAQGGIIPYLTGLVGFHSLFTSGAGSALWSVLAAEIWEWTPFTTLICLAGLSSLPHEPFEAAAVDGASPLQMLRYLTLPLMRPFLMIAVILRFIAAYKVFDTPYIMTSGGPGTATQLLSIRVYQIGFVDLQLGEASALSILILVVAIVLTKIFQRMLQSRSAAEV